jgi:hypothetical protein
VDKLLNRGETFDNQGQVFNFRRGYACPYRTIAMNKTGWLKVETWPKQVLGILLLALMLPDLTDV